MNDAGKKNPSLRELFAQPVPLTVGTLTLHVTPMGWMKGAAAMEHLLPCTGALPLLGDDVASKEERAARWAAVVVTFRDEIAAFCAEASDLPIEDIQGLPPTAMLELVVGLVEINLDFFVQSLPGLVQRGRGRLAALTDRLEAAMARQASASSTSSSA